jgi:hypothetical protein
MNIQETFTNIFVNKKWGDGETISGECSTLENTQGIRKRLPACFKLWGIKSIVDAPCGDYNWFKEMNTDINYIGVDIVPQLIKYNNDKYADENHSFQCLDLCKDVVPQVDLILCRDCLMHLSNEDGIKVLKQFKKSNSKYLLITTNPDNPANLPITSGQFRHVNMTKPPFNLPEPILLVNEEFNAYNGMFSDKSLGLWEINSLSF